jgi:phospholipid/cholesterol/gamma-HCH transport system substrate-binding protein
MKRFRERDRMLTALVGIAVVVALLAGALEFPRLPFIHDNATYQAEFADAGGLATGDIVTVDGVKVGAITGMALDGNQVTVTFTVAGADLGSTTSAAAKVLSPVGTEYMEVTPSGPGTLRNPIPRSRTSVPYNLVTDLSGLGSEISHYDLGQLEHALDVGSQDLNGTPVSQTVSAFKGLAGISRAVGDESSALATIVTQGAALSGVLSSRSSQLFDLFGQSNLVLAVLAQRKAAMAQLLAATTSLSRQITSVLSVNQPQLTSLLGDLQSVSGVLAHDSNDIAAAIPLLAAFSRYAANATGSGAFVDVAVPTLLVPDNLVAQCATPGAFPSTNAQVGCRP